MRAKWIAVLLVTCLSAGFVTRVWSKEKPEKPEKPAEDAKAAAGAEQPGEPDMAAMMAKCQAASTPGENHRHLDTFVGTWDLSLKMWMGGPGSEPSQSKGTSEVKWVLDGRFLMEEFKSEMKMPGPDGDEVSVPFSGLGLTGYDNFRKRYVGSWCDNVGTYLVTMHGLRDADGKTFRYYGEMDEPMHDAVGRPVKYVNTIVDADTHVFTIYDLHAGEGQKVLEVTYTRKGAKKPAAVSKAPKKKE